MSDRQNNFSYSASSYVSSNFTQSSSSSASASASSPGSFSGSGTTRRFTETMTSNDRDGTSIRRTHEESGRPTVQEETYIPPAGGRISGTGFESGSRSASASALGGLERGRVEDVTDDAEQAEKDRLYEERIEDEYAKREGGA
ncbi:hypothetical protein A1O3_07265 [Capronia epimyces CBS 606.96]|uniref:Uncharacterized protein n=1 Tax=Capronia epimyces CBS 606.96 TaxID=1182542 RepID=W9XKE2_9EURO|nr:uncharacterized protein A1O3_07265 [Capronia epimyces CBS 606.96]EXJ80977.1 hypothetical protein A1O3_07265 [Capronia epimyces CBS 606.96]